MSAARLSLEQLDYELPPELIAQTPLEQRDASRLLVVERGGGSLGDRRFRELPALLRPGDVLVRNDTRVYAARCYFRRATGGRLEVLFLRHADVTPERWIALVRGRPQGGEVVSAESGGWRLRCETSFGDGRWLVTNLETASVIELMAAAGQMPLPPYIKTPLADAERYQTTYANEAGSAAAPTAGLHFTPALDTALAAAGIAIETLTLHVGLGTFKPLQEEALESGRLHAESYEVESATWRRLLAARADGRRIIAVGTTTVRTLEHVAAGGELRGETTLFIQPGFAFGLVDGMITNFHLPRSSLLALVMAFAGEAPARRAYEHAIAARYRFYSFGDAMLVL